MWFLGSRLAKSAMLLEDQLRLKRLQRRTIPEDGDKVDYVYAHDPTRLQKISGHKFLIRVMFLISGALIALGFISLILT